MKETKGGRGTPTGAGAEAAEGIHSADNSKGEEQNTALDNMDRDQGDARRGSEPTQSHPTEHQSGYGGGGVNGGNKGV